MGNFGYLVNNKKLKFYLKLILYLIPITLLIWFVFNFSINIPIGDHYKLIDLWEKISQGTFNFEDFFAPENEHRIFFPKIIFSILAFNSNWNVKFETYLSIPITIVSFYLIYRIAAVSQDYQKRGLFHLFNILTCFYLFSLSQVENWVWGFQLAWFLVNACVILAVFFLTIPKNLSPKIRLCMSALSCFIASFSLAHGLFSWLAVIPSVLAINGNAKQKKIRIFFWGLVFIFCCLIYSIDYQKPTSSPDVFLVFNNPLITIIYLLKLLGNPIINNQGAPIIGFFILLSFLFLNFYYITNYHSKFALYAAPWLSIGWFAIIFSLITTVGRVGFGVDYAASSKYTTVSILLIISCLQMWRILMSYQSFWQEKLPRRLSYFTVGVLVSFSLYSYVNIIPLWQLETSVYRNSGRTCFEVIYYLDESLLQQSNLHNCIWFLYGHHWSIKNFRDFADSLEKVGFRNFPKNLEFIIKPSKAPGNINIPAENLTLSKSQNLYFNGWAMPIEYSQLPKLIFFSYGNSQSFFASAFVQGKKPFAKDNSNLNESFKVAWSADISVQSLPLGENIIKAWVYDRKNKQFIKLGNKIKVRVIEE